MEKKENNDGWFWGKTEYRDVEGEEGRIVMEENIGVWFWRTLEEGGGGKTEANGGGE